MPLYVNLAEICVCAQQSAVAQPTSDETNDNQDMPLETAGSIGSRGSAEAEEDDQDSDVGIGG